MGLMILMQLGNVAVSMGLQITFYTAAAYCVARAVRAGWKGK